MPKEELPFVIFAYLAAFTIGIVPLFCMIIKYFRVEYRLKKLGEK